jgi:hypothetical protein
MRDPLRPTTPSDDHRSVREAPQRLALVHPDRDRDSGPKLARPAPTPHRGPAHRRRERIG